MIELIKKAMYTGIGFAAITKDKVEEVVTELIDQGNMSETEGKKFVDEVMEKSRQSQHEFQEKLEAMVADMVGKLNLATKSELESLQQEVESLKEKIQEMEKQE